MWEAFMTVPSEPPLPCFVFRRCPEELLAQEDQPFLTWTVFPFQDAQRIHIGVLGFLLGEGILKKAWLEGRAPPFLIWAAGLLHRQ